MGEPPRAVHGPPGPATDREPLAGEDLDWRRYIALEVPMEDKLLTYAEAAALLGVRIGTLYALVSQRRIPHLRLGRRLVRFSRVALTDWLESKSVAAEPTPKE
jgi:excisionase family DNA binding protein